MTLFTELLTIKEASKWASGYLAKDVTSANISYLIQYGKIKKYGENGTTAINKHDLIAYYNSYNGQRETSWRTQLGNDLNWALSFDYLKEKDTTKHVHRLHPYKGKFIPQLVEYFLDDHTDSFKTETYFNAGDIILDPFCGSGTALVQANELGMHAIGIDISAFNALISNVKVSKVDFVDLARELNRLSVLLNDFIGNHNNTQFENALLNALNIFNKQHFPSPEYKIRVRNREIDEREYAPTCEQEFLKIFNKLQHEYNIKIEQDSSDSFLGKWFLEPVRRELDFMHEQLNTINNSVTKQIITIILSRTMRSCRATTHADLATLKDPITHTYYCRKHGKICKPIFSIRSWWDRYRTDTIKRLNEFGALRTNTFQRCLQGDARSINVFEQLDSQSPELAHLVKKQKIQGIFSSPPYVGLIDYHEQHAYAYDLFGYTRKDDSEIGPLCRGQGRAARESYVAGISEVLKNTKQYLQKDYDVFLVANDKYNLYPHIAERAGMQIVNRYKRPVLNRTEKDKSAYAEMIFHMRGE